MFWLMKQMFVHCQNQCYCDLQVCQTVDNQITIDQFPGMLIIFGPNASSPSPCLPLWPLCWNSAKPSWWHCDNTDTLVHCYYSHIQYIHDSYSALHLSGTKDCFQIHYRTNTSGKYRQKSFITMVSEKSMDCMSIQMVPREETELHRKHSHSIIVSLEVWLAWDGRWMISWPEYIHIIHKQTTQNWISIKGNKEKEIKQPFLVVFFNGTTHDFHVF